jgi:hypothetical protein
MFGADFSDGRTFHKAFWQKSTTQADALREWLLQPETLQRIERAAHLLSDDGFEHLFPPALEVLRRESTSLTT